MTTYSAIASNKRRSALFVVLFALFVIFLGWLFDQLEGGGTLLLPLAVLMSCVSAVIGYIAGDKMALAANGAIPVQKNDNPEVYRLVENLAITAGIPTPRVYIIPSPAMNAFATGRDPEHASIAITAGLLETLSRDEIEGVLAHEFSHIKNFDTRLMTVVAIFVGVVALLGDWFFRARLFGMSGRDRDDRGNGNGIFMILGLILLLLSPLVAQCIQFAISRRREFLADASGVLLTRYPDGLIHALEKIGAANRPVETANSATAHLYFANPLSGRALSNLFSTHPPIEERIAALRKMG